MDMLEKIPAITAYQQALNAYNPNVYPAHKKITAEEWNALLLSGFAQGNRQEYYLEQIVNGHLTELIETVNAAIDVLEDHELRLRVTEALNYYDKEEVDGLLDGKVNKEAGKGLSTNDLTNNLKTAYDEAVNKKHEHSNKTVLDLTTEPFTTVIKAGYDDANTKKHTHSNKIILDATTASYTTDEKSKLATLESSHFRGQYLSKTALDSAVPSGSVGDYAYVDSGAGFLVQKYLWDSSDNEWVPAASEGGEETPASIKHKYESNLDTNAYTDADKAKVANALVANGDSKDLTATFTEAETLANIATGESHATLFGKIKKAISSLFTHTASTANPHLVTKAQVGLGNVANKDLSNVANKDLSNVANKDLSNVDNLKQVATTTDQDISGIKKFINTVYAEKISGTNLFNINGNINTQYNGNISTANSVSNDILTSNTNSTITYSAGQFVKLTANKAYTLTVKCLSIGSGTRGNVYLYYRNNNALQFNVDFTAGDTTKTITFTPSESEVLISFSTFGGTGAQFTDIMFNLGAVALPHNPFIGDVLFTGKTNEITARQRFHNIVEVEKIRGRNLFYKLETALGAGGSGSLIGGWIRRYADMTTATQFTVSFVSPVTRNVRLYIQTRSGDSLAGSSGVYNRQITIFSVNVGAKKTHTFNLTSADIAAMQANPACLYVFSDTTTDFTSTNIDYQLELGSTATPYTPFIGEFVDEITLDQTKNSFLTQISGLAQQIQALSADLIISFAESGFATAISCTQSGTSKTSPFTATAAATIVITLTKPSSNSVWRYSFDGWTVNGNSIISGSGGYTITENGNTQTLSFSASTTTKGSFVGSVVRRQPGGTV